MKSSIRLETNAPRADWKERVEESGLIWHGAGGESYWTEDEHLVLTLKAAETLEDAASELHAMRADMTPEEYEQELECNPDAAIRGAYWGKELATAEAEGRMCAIEPAPGPVHTVWDLGMGDSTAIWWWQAHGKEIRVLDFYENHGHGLEHYAAVCAAKPWPSARRVTPQCCAFWRLSVMA